MNAIASQLVCVVVCAGAMIATSTQVYAQNTIDLTQSRSEAATATTTIEEDSAVSREEYALLLEKANLHVARGNLDLANDLYREAMQSPARTAEVFLNLARTERKLGNDEKAKATLMQGLNEFPTSVKMRYGLVNYLLKTGQDVAAYQQLKRFPSRARNEEKYQYLYALTSYRIGELTDSIRNFRQLSQQSTKYEDDAHYWLGFSYARKREHQAAKREFAKAASSISDPQLLAKIDEQLKKIEPKNERLLFVGDVAAGIGYDSNIQLSKDTNSTGAGADAVRFWANSANKLIMLQRTDHYFALKANVYLDANLGTGGTTRKQLNTLFFDVAPSYERDIWYGDGRISLDLGYTNAVLPLSDVCATGGINCAGMKSKSFAQRIYQRLTLAKRRYNVFRLKFDLMHYTDIYGLGNPTNSEDRDAIAGSFISRLQTSHIGSTVDWNPRISVQYNNAKGVNQQYIGLNPGVQMGLSFGGAVRAYGDAQILTRIYPNYQPINPAFDDRQDNVAIGEVGARYAYARDGGVTASFVYEQNLTKNVAFQYERWQLGVYWDYQFAVKK